MKMERNEELSGITKRRHRITSLRASTDGGMLDDERNVLGNKFDWDQILVNSQRKKSRYGSYKNGWEQGDDDRRVFRSFAIRGVDEMLIGVRVPRKNRSVLTKRLNKNWSFRNAGFGRGLVHHRRFLQSDVVMGRRLCRASPRNGVSGENMKSLGPEPLPKAVGDTSLVQDDEIEVVEALFDLMNQTHSELDRSKKNDVVRVCTSGRNKEPVTNKTSTKTSYLPPKSGCLGINGGLVKKGVGLSVMNDDLIAEDDNNLAWSKYSVMQSGNLLPRSTVDVIVGKEKVFDKRGEELFNDLKRISSKKRVVAPQDEEFPLHANQISDKQVDSILLEGNPAAELIETKREAKFQTDLMRKIADEEVKNKQEENKIEPSVLRHGSSKPEQFASNCSGRSELVKGGQEQNQCKPLISGHKFALPNSLPSPIFGTGWARGLPHPGFMPPFQIVMPDTNARPLAAFPVFMQHPPFLPSQQRRKRCATHQYIAHNILCHQQLIKNLTTLPATPGPSSIYSSEAPRPDPLISKQNKTDGMNVPNNKQQVFQQVPQQITTANALGPALVVRIGQHQTDLWQGPALPMVPPTNQNAAALLSKEL